MSSDTAYAEWSEITEDKATVVVKLETLVADQEVLAKQGYVFDPLTEQQLQAKNRCQRCAKPLPKITICQIQPPFETQQQYEKWTAHEERMMEKQRCLYHPRGQWSGKWTCCGQHMFAVGCHEANSHSPCSMADIRQDWEFRRTPEPRERSILVPRSRLVEIIKVRGENVRTAVALDCEMGTSTIGTSPLIKLSVVDFMTGDTLINEFVIPSLDMLHYNTKFSGITFKDMRNARSDEDTLWGTERARAELLKYVDSETFIIVHSGQNDLSALRLCHPADKIVDTYTLEVNDPNLPEGLKKSLKEVCARRCGIAIQNKRLSNGQLAGHDPLEDAMAAREIVCSWLADMDSDDETEYEGEFDGYEMDYYDEPYSW